MYTFEDLVNITNKLRSEKGCPWDREQTYESLKKNAWKRRAVRFLTPLIMRIWKTFARSWEISCFW